MTAEEQLAEIRRLANIYCLVLCEYSQAKRRERESWLRPETDPEVRAHDLRMVQGLGDAEDRAFEDLLRACGVEL